MIGQYPTINFDHADLKRNTQQLETVTWICFVAHENKGSRISEKQQV
jgi:hypothetical protein